MSILCLNHLFHQCRTESPRFRHENPRSLSRLNFSTKALNFCKLKPLRVYPIRAGFSETALVESDAGVPVLFSERFEFKRTQAVEGTISVRLEAVKERQIWELTVGCNLPGKWVLHWGVTYCDDVGREWDQPPPEMRPPGSILIKNYAIETTFKRSPSILEGQILHEVKINFSASSSISDIHFVLKEEEVGAWYQHRGRDFRVPLTDCLDEDDYIVGGEKGFRVWPGAFGQISSTLLGTEGSRLNAVENIGGAKHAKKQNQRIDGFYEEYSILKEENVQTFVTVSVSDSQEKDKNLVHFDTDLQGVVTVHWGVCRDNDKRWEIPAAPHPSETNIFRKRALQTLLLPKENRNGSQGLLSLNKEFMGVLFVLKLNENTWIKNMGSDFYVPLTSECSLVSNTALKANQAVSNAAYTDGIINGIRNLVIDISSEKGSKIKNKEAQEKILQEIETLAAEAYGIFRSSSATFLKEPVSDIEELMPPVKICSATGSGYEVLCQSFNWESHKSGRWYSELNDKATDISSMGFTTIWLPPPTDSVSPEGYMPRDLYNLNSRYGSMDELKILVNRLHKVGVQVLGDVVLNHRCAQYQNQNGVWNMFGGRLNWDDRAVVADDPHFQGRGNKSSGDNFHAAPNIDHSQDFVRNDLKEWLCWLREEIGYDGWRLDFVRGFWGGYVKDYLDATKPFFTVGEYWDSLSYTYGEMDHNQDAHRQRIVDWINATNGTAGAFDVTTKGILHSALQKCEYWRLSDEKGKPPGVVGWWPSRAVTFIENHDTGSTQGHWRFPSGKEIQGYAYILTHPGTPSVFYDHIFSDYRDEIAALISLRHRTKINCRSTVQIVKAKRDVYAAFIDEKVMVKLGPGHYEPQSGPQKWVLAVEGNDYKVWESS